MESVSELERKMKNSNTLIKVPCASVLILLLHVGTAGFMVFGQSETAQQVVNRSSQAYGDQWSNGRLTDLVATGKIWISGIQESGPLDFILTVKQKEKVKRVVHFSGGGDMSWGSDGKKSWQKSGRLIGDAAGPAAYFIDNQTKRSIASLFDRNNSLKDLGPADKKHAPESELSRVIESKNDKDQATRYYIDDTTSLIRRIEFDTGGFYTMFFGDTQYPLFAAYVFSDYRTVSGFVIPFRIEVYHGLIKIEELTFTSVQCNVGIKDDQFVP
jgi:hypothetical protein